jgi:hypothetical protein
VKLSSSTLRKAAELQERIEQLEGELQRILDGEGTTGRAPAAPRSAPTAPNNGTVRARGRKPKAQTAATTTARPRGRRSAGSSGPLAPAVVEVLKRHGSPMGVTEILDALLSNGYKFSSPEPKKNLFARIYRLKGVKQVGPGRFAAE